MRDWLYDFSPSSCRLPPIQLQEWRGNIFVSFAKESPPFERAMVEFEKDWAQLLFDELYRELRQPITIEAEGAIQRVHGGGAADRASFERALRRAGGGNSYGKFVHFTLGFHSAAMWTARQFIEDIHLPGSNAIGMGLPSWESGGGENHPDGIVLDQSLWVGDTQLVDGGEFVGPEPLRRLHTAMSCRLD